MKVIYLGAFKAKHPKWDIVYQDMYEERDLPGDMLEINLDGYDVIIATPPCNWWSRANYRRNTSQYALETKHLLPGILKRLIENGKPFLVENVRNRSLFSKHGLINIPGVTVYEYGRHTYWTNRPFPINLASQEEDDPHNMWSSNPNRQGGINVHHVVEIFLADNLFRDKLGGKQI